MSDKRWLETIATVAIPIVGLIYTGMTWLVAEEATERSAALTYVHDLSNNNDPAAQAIAAAMLIKLVTAPPSIFDLVDGKANLRNDVVQMVQAVAYASQDAASAKNAAAVYAAWKNTPANSNQFSPATSAGMTVYVQYADDVEKPAATELSYWLQEQGDFAPGIQLVQSSDSSTEVQYFSTDTKLVSLATDLNKKLQSCQIASSAQDYSSHTAVNHMQIEIYLGGKDAGNIAKDDMAACLQ